MAMTANLRHTNARATALASARREATCWLTIPSQYWRMQAQLTAGASPDRDRCRWGAPTPTRSQPKHPPAN